MRASTLVIALALLPLASQAQQDFDYTFVELSYLNADLDAGALNVDGDGLAIDGSVEVAELVYVFAGYATYDYDLDIDADSYNIGAGLHWPLRSELDLLVDFSWVHASVDTPFASADDDGISFGAGVRARVHDAIELQGAVHYVDLDDTSTILSLGGRYYFSEALAVSLEADIDDDTTVWSVGIRAEFGD